MQNLGKYCPQIPWPKQQLFLELKCKEAFFGGAAGGSKSSALLMGALQYVHIPNYAALILRKDAQRLNLSGGLIPRSHQWLHGKAQWNGTTKRWSFPNGASIQFGYLDSANDKYRYGSSEYQYIAFDELTEFTEEDYTFLFSRLRMTSDLERAGVPYRIRSASNPGGVGHLWVRQRFVTEEAENDLRESRLKGVYYKAGLGGEVAAFVPSKIADNPAINQVEYTKNLMHLPPVTRERLLDGDWTIMPTGLIKPEWLRYFTMRHEMVDLLKSISDGQGGVVHTSDVIKSFNVRECRRFVTVDTAGGMEDITQNAKGKTLSWTVAGVWDHIQWGETQQALICKYIWRQRAGFTDVCDALRMIFNQYHPHRIRCEDQTMGPSLYNVLKGELPIDLIATEGKDKVTRSTTLQNMMKCGQVYLPREDNSWRPTFEAELLSWQGLKDETNDQIDMAAYAAIEAGGAFGGTIIAAVDPREDFFERGTMGGMKEGKGFWN